ncbi:Lrp/AsnC ligand binding domain-containing protein [Hoeflea ulvae]|uniref:Lrp/AsnC ligand binding domain-containing protein n=1 Tax=Hoeflea ulvae TaxID=2983764 RepID=A0ABT3YKF2_9HYPH|nr:Lrp/AsnC ligand binding domain-containing protein [Hoeflea ulvae]MCY0096318.1 Lrp/AsnC ligand binding domain-containing protein [Hoeflea ulvae]
MRRNLDPIDRRIVNELQTHGRQSIVDLADRVHLTKTPCSERVKRLERDGIITGYSAKIDPGEVDMGHVMIVHVNLSKTSDSSLEDFNRAVRLIPEVQSCLMIAGPFDYMLKVRTRDITQFRELLGERISKLPSVMQTHSFAVMETVKETSMIEMSL